METYDGRMQYDEDTLIRDRKKMMEAHSASVSFESEEERELRAWMAAQDPANALEGWGSTTCSCKKEIMQGTGAGYAHFACDELYVGQCRWRIAREPSKDCMFRAQTRVKIDGHTMPIESCTRIEAQEKASRIWAEENIFDASH